MSIMSMKNIKSTTPFIISHSKSSFSVNARRKGVTAQVNININETNRSHYSFQVSSGYIIHFLRSILFILRRYFALFASGESSSDELPSPPKRPQQTNYGSASSSIFDFEVFYLFWICNSNSSISSELFPPSLNWFCSSGEILRSLLAVWEDLPSFSLVFCLYIF